MQRFVLTLAVVAVLGVGADARAGGIFGGAYSATVTFANAPGMNVDPAGLAWDGTNYWSVDGGFSVLTNQAVYDGAGNVIDTFTPGIDFRSVFTDGLGGLFARQFADPTIYQQTSPGVFSSTGVVLADPLGPKAQVVLSGDKTEYVSMESGVVHRWDLAGNALSPVTLTGYGSGTQNDDPQNRSIAAAGDFWLTFDNGRLSGWTHSGALAGTTLLLGPNSSFSANFSLSFAKGMVFVADGNDGRWRGYDVFGVATRAPEPGSLTLGILGLVSVGGMALAKRRRRARAVD